ncbi:MAG: hypothetical protein WD970_02265 [Patescibacteria group bacterium]
MMIQQPALLMGTPKIVENAIKNLDFNRGRVAKTTADIDLLETRLEAARGTITERQNNLKESERSYILTCCSALISLLEKEGKGYCPKCQALVPYQGHAVMFHPHTIHHPEVSAREYRQGSDAYDEKVFHWYQVPHQCSFLSEPSKELELAARGNGRYLGRHFFMGTIADAPPDLFMTYGIPPLDSEMVRRHKLLPWQFLPQPVKKPIRQSA